MSICRGFGCLGGGGRRERGEERGKRRKMKEEEGKRGRRKRRREGEVKRKSGLTKMLNLSPFFFFIPFLSLIIISPLTKCLFFPIQQYPSSMKNSPDPVWYSIP